MKNNPSVLTPKEAARLCGLSSQTITRAFDAGRLKGYRVPGSKFRRIPRAELLRFMSHHGMPLPEGESLSLQPVA